MGVESISRKIAFQFNINDIAQTIETGLHVLNPTVLLLISKEHIRSSNLLNIHHKSA